MITRGPPRSSGVTAHSARPSWSMSPAATNPPKVKFASPNGSVGAKSTLPSFPLTTAITVLVPGPVTSTVSATPSPLKSPVATRTSPANPGNGAAGPPTSRNVPVASRSNTRAAPSGGPPTASRETGTAGGGAGGGGGGGGGGGLVVCGVADTSADGGLSPPAFIAVSR